MLNVGRWLPVFILAAQVPGPLLCQTPPDQLLRVSVDLVQVDAVVTDSSGRYVEDLRREEFTLREDGKPREITYFSYVTQGPRTIVFLLDDSVGSALFRHGSRSFLHDFIDSEVRPDDRIAILCTVEGSGAQSRFGADKARLHEAVRRCGPVARTGLAQVSAMELGREEVVAKGSTGSVYAGEIPLAGMASYVTLGGVLDGMAEIPGRKAVVLVSRMLGWIVFRKIPEELRDLADRANRAGATIYILDTGDFDSPTSARRAGVPPPYWEVAKGLRLIGGDYLAPATGGFALHPSYYRSYFEAAEIYRKDTAERTEIMMGRMSKFLADGLRQIVADLTGHYMIGYKPDAAASQKDASRFHSIRLEVKRRGLTVRARQGYRGAPDSTLARPPATEDGLLEAALRSPFRGDAIPVGMMPHDSASPVGSGGRMWAVSAHALLSIPSEELSFEQQPDGTRRAAVEARVTAHGELNRQVAAAARTCEMTLAPGHGQDQVRRPLLCALDLPMQRPGAYLLRAAMLDKVSLEVGSAYALVDVKDFNRDALTMSSLILRGDSTNPVERVFAPGDTIQYSAQITGALLDKATGKHALQARLFLYSLDDREYARLGPFPVQVEEGAQRMFASGKIRLAEDEAPGRYSLILELTDLARPAKRGQVREKDQAAMGFTVAERSAEF